MRAQFAAAVAAVLAFAAGEAAAAAPSFDCKKAGSWAEKEICRGDELAALDAWFSPLYAQVVQRSSKADADAVRAERKAWLKTRNDCKDAQDGAACLADRYREIIAALEQRLARLIAGNPGVRGAAPAARSPLDECGGADSLACLENLLSAAETDLAAAETKAAGDRVAESNLAWREYRNAECKRRQGIQTSAPPEAAYAACLIELTRQRIHELNL